MEKPAAGHSCAGMATLILFLPHITLLGRLVLDFRVYQYITELIIRKQQNPSPIFWGDKSEGIPWSSIEKLARSDFKFQIADLISREGCDFWVSDLNS
jgi:hypothetical protein